MAKYTVRKYNDIAKFWSIYHTTCDISDAYRVHAELTASGAKASIESQYVSE